MGFFPGLQGRLFNMSGLYIHCRSESSWAGGLARLFKLETCIPDWVW